MVKMAGSSVPIACERCTPELVHYSFNSATKAAVVNLMQAHGEAFRPFRVRINALNPE